MCDEFIEADAAAHKGITRRDFAAMGGAAALMALRENAEVRARFAAAGAEMVLSGPALLRERLVKEVPQWQRLVAAVGINVE